MTNVTKFDKIPRTKSVSCRLNAQVETALRELAKKDHRTFASYMEHVLSVHVQEKQRCAHGSAEPSVPEPRARLVTMLPVK